MGIINRVLRMPIFPKFAVSLLLIVFYCSGYVSSDTHNKRPEVRLKDVVPEGYDNFQTPKNNGDPTDVSIRIEILNIRSVNVADMSYIGDIFLYKTWRDTRLKFPANASLPQIALNPKWRDYLWTPDVYFHNALGGQVLNAIIPYVSLWLKNDSTVVFGARLSLQLSCDMLLYDFPHDEQNCDIIVKSSYCGYYDSSIQPNIHKKKYLNDIDELGDLFYSSAMTHTLSEMNLHWSNETNQPLSIGDLFLLPQFNFGNPEVTSCKDHNSKTSHPGNFACLRGLFKLSRRTGYYVINIYIPTILIVFMSMLTFWMPPEAVPGRVTLGVTSLLTIITKQYQASLPAVSYVVALNVWLSCCIGFVFCSLLEYACVISLCDHNKRVRAASSSTIDKIPSTNVKNDQSWWSQISNIVMTRIENIDCHTIDRTSRAVFPAAFALQCICYWAYYAA